MAPAPPLLIFRWKGNVPPVYVSFYRLPQSITVYDVAVIKKLPPSPMIYNFAFFGGWVRYGLLHPLVFFLPPQKGGNSSLGVAVPPSAYLLLPPNSFAFRILATILIVNVKDVPTSA